ncbi:MAG TPA: hypothetical protein VHV31_09200, partial [Nitrolancea sp.]|nr:hypothetical protein [Nitrolancea sp.]
PNNTKTRQRKRTSYHVDCEKPLFHQFYMRNRAIALRHLTNCAGISPSVCGYLQYRDLSIIT